ncbi:MAG: MerR family DNA-binding transcriptional regulator, partial [Clostridia bacterium]|nr:MerR family DNA-binding transcriptional regulator [Clostridia bacterium]
MRMHYTISEMSKLLGVTTHMLRYYEKIGIIRPVVNPENGYRYYSVVDTR